VTKSEIGTIISRGLALYALVQAVANVRSLLFTLGNVADLVAQGERSITFFATVFDGVFPLLLLVAAWVLWRKGPRIGRAMTRDLSAEREEAPSFDGATLERVAVIVTGLVLVSWFLPMLTGGIGGFVWWQSFGDPAFAQGSETPQFVWAIVQASLGTLIGAFLLLGPGTVLRGVHWLRQAGFKSNGHR
jgi:hypothetical protein